MKSHAMTAFALVLSIGGAMGSYAALNAVWAQVPIRTYKVYGKETLDGGGEWQYPTNSLHRFFKVSVEMP